MSNRKVIRQSIIKMSQNTKLYSKCLFVVSLYKRRAVHINEVRHSDSLYSSYFINLIVSKSVTMKSSSKLIHKDSPYI